MLPNFLCIGAQKSGTTTLLNQLGRHPDIFMSPARETRFFLMDHIYSQGISAYESTFFADWNGQKAVGEKTPEYLYDPLIPRRIAETLGTGVRLIATFRSPAQRAYSHYRHNFQQFWENLSFEEAMHNEAKRCSAGRYQKLRYGYLDRGRYSVQIKRYLNLFPKSAFLFLVYEQDIVNRQTDSLKRIFEFLHVDSSFAPPNTVSAGRAVPVQPRILEKNEQIETDGMYIEGRVGDLLLTRLTGKPKLVRNPSPQLVDFARGTIRNMPLHDALSRDMELAINKEHFSDDISAMSEIIGRDLGDWLR